MLEPGITLLITFLLIVAGWYIFRPERGLWWQLKRARHQTQRVLSEDALKHIHKCDTDRRQASCESLAGVLQLSLDDTTTLLADMQQRQLITNKNNSLHLTPAGRESALHIIRAHRLWERYLADKTGYAESEWHQHAEQIEHSLTPSEANMLASRLGNPTHDPHGDPIPTASGVMMTSDSVLLTELAVDMPAQITHLEDEPTTVYAQLVAEGLYPGMVVHMMENSTERIRFWSEKGEHTIAPIVAHNVSITPLPEIAMTTDTTKHLHLSDIILGEFAEVTRLSPTCRGMERRRFLDLGILPGTKISVEFGSPSGNPTAYRIRGSVIALRHEQASLVDVKKIEA